MVMLPHDIPPDAAVPPPDTSTPKDTISSNYEVLDTPHSEALERALRRILSTDVAEFTYAQIVDGLPTEESLHEFQSPRPGHPVVGLGHRKLCDGALEKARKFRTDLDMASSQLSLSVSYPHPAAFKSSNASSLTRRGKLLLAFQDTTPGSKHFHLRLIELLAVSCHQIAVYLYSLDEGVHKHSEYEAWRSMPPDSSGPYPLPRAPVVFCHNYYIEYDRYQNGVADCVGYWAEAKIFGGVVVFDRGETDREVGFRVPNRVLGGVSTFIPTANFLPF